MGLNLRRHKFFNHTAGWQFGRQSGPTWHQGNILTQVLIQRHGQSGTRSAAGIEAYLVTRNEAKARYLGVKMETLAIHGAVSEETAREMAAGACRLSGADIGVGITGIAGPDGGNKEKPVGLIFFALSARRGVVVERHCFVGDREYNRLAAATTALNMVRKHLLDKG